MRTRSWYTPPRIFLASLLRLLTGVRCLCRCPPGGRQSIYYANHTSHLDALVIWACLPDAIRRRTRPVAAGDYWSGGLRGFFANNIFDAVLVDRGGRFDKGRLAQALAPVHAALDQGDSLILFPEGTRSMQDDGHLLPFKSGLFRLARAYPDVALVPVWLENLNRMLPKGGGAWLPVPLLCSLIMGEPLHAVQADEDRRVFLARAEAALLALAPPHPDER